MYNIYCEEKKLYETDRKLKEEKDLIIHEEKHKKKTDMLVNNYQKRIRKFIIDVRMNNIL
jgi:hypothetical protein